MPSAILVGAAEDLCGTKVTVLCTETTVSNPPVVFPKASIQKSMNYLTCIRYLGEIKGIKPLNSNRSRYKFCILRTFLSVCKLKYWDAFLHTT